MARWGRRGLFYWLNGGDLFRRTKSVQWGSRPLGGGMPSMRKGLFAPRRKTMKLGARRGLASFTPSRTAKAPAPNSGGMKLGRRSKPLFAGSSRPAMPVRPFRSGTMKTGSGGGSGWGARAAAPKKRKGTLWLIFLTVFILVAIQSFIYVDRHLRIPMMNVAKVRMNQIATQAINMAITEQVASQASFDKLIDWKTSGDGKISGFMLNYSEHMKITSETIETVAATLYDMQHLEESIPIGHALNSAILSSYGPRIPVKFEPVGATQVQLNTRQSSIGINNTLVEVYVKVVTEISIIIPFDSEPQVVEAEIPVSYLLVVGDVPMYYYDNKGNPVGESAQSAPNISLPMTPREGGQEADAPTDGINAPGVIGDDAAGADGAAPAESAQPAPSEGGGTAATPGAGH